MRAARALSGRAKLRGSPLRVFDSCSRTANGEESEDDEERLLYFLMENEFFSGRTCTLTPDRALAGLQAMPAAAVAKMTPDVEAAPASPARDALRQLMREASHVQLALRPAALLQLLLVLRR